MVTGYWNAGGMNLGEARIATERATFVSAIGGGDVATASIRRKKKTLP